MTGRTESLSIALMLESDGPGGAEVMVLELAEELRRRGHSICHVGPDNGCGWLAGRFRERGLETDTFSLRKPLDLSCLGGMVRMLRSRRIDVIHSHEFTMAVYGAACARLLRLPHIITLHGGPSVIRNLVGHRRRRLALRWAASSSDYTVAVSAAIVADLQQHLSLRYEHIRVILNGVEPRVGQRQPTRIELGLAEGEPLILAVGNLYRVKGHSVLIRALATLHRDDPDLSWRLAIAGRGEDEEQLLALAREEGVFDRLHLLGYREDIPNLLAAAEIYAMPSLSEGTPLALVEAMLAGAAIVASGVGGIPSMVAAGREALLVPPNDPEALARELSHLIQDPARREALGRAARQRALAEFTAARMADAYERLYTAGPASR